MLDHWRCEDRKLPWLGQEFQRVEHKQARVQTCLFVVVFYATIDQTKKALKDFLKVGEVWETLHVPGGMPTSPVVSRAMGLFGANAAGFFYLASTRGLPSASRVMQTLAHMAESRICRMR